MGELSDYFNEKFIPLNEAKKLNKMDIARKLGCAYNTVSNCLEGESLPGPEYTRGIAECLGLDPEEAIRHWQNDKLKQEEEEKGKVKEPPAVYPEPGPCRIPVVSLIRAGEPQDYVDNPPDDWLDCPAGLRNADKAIAFKVEGDSMQSRLAPGDIIVVDVTKPCNVGDIVVVRLADGGCFVRKISEKTSSHYLFQAMNPAYSPTIAPVKKVKWMGKVVNIKIG